MVITNTNSVRAESRAMSAYNIYLLQVQGIMDGVRAARAKKDYIPPQLGGPFNQRVLLESKSTIQIINFNVV